MKQPRRQLGEVGNSATSSGNPPNSANPPTRKRLTLELVARALLLRDREGLPVTEIAAQLGVGKSALYEALGRHDREVHRRHAIAVRGGAAPAPVPMSREDRARGDLLVRLDTALDRLELADVALLVTIADRLAGSNRTAPTRLRDASRAPERPPAA